METLSFARSRCALAAAALILLTNLRGSADNAPAPAPIPPDDVMDIDAMAARIPVYQDVYKQVRDQALAALKKTHPGHDGDAAVQTYTRAAVYLNLWGDYYGEDVVRHSAIYYIHMDRKDATSGNDPLIGLNNQESSFVGKYPSSDESALEVIRTADAMGASDYPALLKLDGYQWAISILVLYKTQGQVATSSPALAQLPALVEKWRTLYSTLIAAKLPHPLLFSLAGSLLGEAQADEETLNVGIAAIDRAFNENDAANPVKLALDGEYFVNAAWTARGTGFANTVSDSAQQLMSQRLNQAETILTDAYTAHPEEGTIARTMMSVELGQGKGRDRMELWFQRAIKDDPNDYAAYKSKEYYLQPRWYGSVDDIVSFGQECVATNNWAARIPVVFPLGVGEIAQLDPTVYQDPKVWDPLAKAYTEILSKYPKSTRYRTGFAKHAYDNGHMDIAREQFKILGNDYNRDVVNEQTHADMMTKLGL